MNTLALPLTSHDALRRRVCALAENRPAVYRMLDASGRVIYVGKAKRLRARLLSYFRARYPETKAARILNAAADIQWNPAPSEFSALLGELRQIRRYRPPFNVRMNRNRRVAFVKISAGPAPKIYVGGSPGGDHVRHYGPYAGVARVKDGVRVLNDLLGLRDCGLTMPVTFSEQPDLFGGRGRSACLRHDFGQCTAPCAGSVSEEDYQRRLAEAVAFLEVRALSPLDRVVKEMTTSSDRQEYELAASWRRKLDSLEWLLAASVRAQAAVAALSFVYTDPGVYGDERAYVIRHGTVRAEAPAPRTPIEREAFDSLVAEHLAWQPESSAIPAVTIDETLLLMEWFRRHPSALHRTVPLAEWPALSARARAET